jgi:hypothetical protein
MPRGRTPAVIAAKKSERQERQAVKALQADLQAIVDGITSATTLADLRGFVRDLARTLRRTLRLPNVSG